MRPRNDGRYFLERLNVRSRARRRWADFAAALVVGWFSRSLDILPVVGPYVPAAKLVAVLVAALICFMLGFRIAERTGRGRKPARDDRRAKGGLRQRGKSAANANLRASSIEKEANAQRKADDETISTLKLAAGCGFEPFPGRVRDNAGAGTGVPREIWQSGGARSADDVAGAAGAGSDMPVSRGSASLAAVAKTLAPCCD